MAAAQPQVLKHYINGKWVEPKGTVATDVMNPATDTALCRVPVATPEEVEECVQAAQKAFLSWRDVPGVQRIQPLLRLQITIKERLEEIAKSITENHGKEIAASRASVVRAYQMIESAICVPEWQKGDYMENVASGIDEYSVRVPIGVCACIPPFNFPAMVPFWFFPFAIAAGCTYIIKSNEQTPLSMQLIFECIDKAGFPPGVIQYIHGDVSTANALIDHPLVKAVSSVGSTPVAKAIYTRTCALGKRAQCHGGANNTIVIMPSSNPDEVMSNIMNSCFGNSGQRCLAGSTVMFCGPEEKYAHFRTRFLDAVKKVKVGSGFDESSAMGPIVSKRALQTLLSQIEGAVKEGVTLAVDGRGIQVPGFPNGYWLGPTVMENVTPQMKIYGEEMFGPIVRICRAADLDEAIALINADPKGNATSIYTENAAEVRKFKHSVEPGMIGVNIGLVAPIAWFPFAGAKDSFFGTLRAQGAECLEFFTVQKVIVERFYGHGKIEWD